MASHLEHRGRCHPRRAYRDFLVLRPRQRAVVFQVRPEGITESTRWLFCGLAMASLALSLPWARRCLQRAHPGSPFVGKPVPTATQVPHSVVKAP